MVLTATYLLVSWLQNPPRRWGVKKGLESWRDGADRISVLSEWLLDVKWVAYMPVKSSDVTKWRRASILTHCKPIEKRWNGKGGEVESVITRRCISSTRKIFQMKSTIPTNPFWSAAVWDEGAHWKVRIRCVGICTSIYFLINWKLKERKAMPNISVKTTKAKYVYQTLVWENVAKRMIIRYTKRQSRDL